MKHFIGNALRHVLQLVGLLAYVSTIFILNYTSLNAQSLTIQLLDQDTKTPVSGVYFSFGDQKGRSSSEGNISINNVAEDTNTPLLLSHQSYGKVLFSAEDLTEILASGNLFLKAYSYNLAPVTIMAMRSSDRPGTQMQSRKNDLLQHDASALIMQDAAISGIRKSGGYGFDPVLRGFKYDQLNVVQDGLQSAIAACPNRMDPPTSQMTVNAIDEVEIIKGPYALRYGVGLGGTLNFKSANLTEWTDDRAFGRLSSSLESNGLIRRTEGVAGFGRNGKSVALFGSYSEGDDYSPAKGADIASGFYRTSIGLKGEFALNEQNDIRVNTNYNHAKNTDFAALAMDLRSDHTWLSKLEHSYRNDAYRIESSAFISLVDHEMDNLSKNLNPRMMNAVTTANTLNYGFRSELQLLQQNKLSYLGIDMRVEQADGMLNRTVLMGPMAGRVMSNQVWQESEIIKPGIFAEQHFHFANQLSFILSGRAEMAIATANDTESVFSQLYDQTDNDQFTLSLATGLNKELDNGLSLSLWVARSQRLASLTERYINYFAVGLDPYELVGNPQIKPETNYQSDLMLSYMGERIGVILNGFISLVDQYITAYIAPDLAPRLPTSPGVRSFQNVDAAFRYGTELSLMWKATPTLIHTFDLAYTFAEDLALNEPLPEIAPLDMQYQLQFNQLNNRLNHSIRLRHVLEQNRVSPAFGEMASPAFTTVDYRSQIQLNSRIQLSVDLNNLLNEQYTEHLNRISRASGIPLFAPGRSVIVTASYKL